MLGRHRREERRDERHGIQRYQMREKLVSIGDDFWIENADGERVFKVNGKALRIRKTLEIEDPHGNMLVKVQERKLHIKDHMAVEGPNGEHLASVKKALISPLHERWLVKIRDGDDIRVHGNIVDHEYTIGDGRDKIAEVSKKWFRVRDTYGIEIEPGQDVVLILAVAVCIDQMAHDRG